MFTKDAWIQSSERLLPLLLLSFVVAACGTAHGAESEESETNSVNTTKEDKTMPGQPYYLEIVSADAEQIIQMYAQSVGAEFGESVQHLGGARVAMLEGGSQIGVRAPMREDEGPLWRVYLQVENLSAAIEGARAAGAQVAIEEMPLGEGNGKIGIVIHGGVEHGFWELD